MAYLDHAATTPMHPEALAAYTDALAVVGNPASIHSAGQAAKRVLEESRERIAATLGADPIEVVFTGGGTEAVNLAIKGLYWRRRASESADAPRRRVVVPAGEHHATIDTVEWLAAHEGAELVDVPIDEVARVRLDRFAEAVGRDGAVGDGSTGVALATMLWASNEVGTLQPVAEAAVVAAAAGVPLHLDAIAAFGHLRVDFREVRGEARPGQGLVALSVSAHKIGGPVGIGALVLDRSANVEPLLHGGGQQRRIRSGTQDVAAAAAFAAAAEAAERDREAESVRLAALRDRLVAGVAAIDPAVRLSGDPDPAGRLPGNAHFAVHGSEGDSLLFLLDAAGVAVSTGSACQAGVAEPSHVLLAMGRSEADARGALRITLGRTSTDADVDAFLSALPDALERAGRAGLSSRSTAFDR